MRAKWYPGAQLNRKFVDSGALGLHLRFAALVGRLVAAHISAHVHATLAVIKVGVSAERRQRGERPPSQL